jgi:creatine kinase
MDKAMADELRGNGNLFQEPTGPALLAAAGAGRDWPNNRGIYCADSRKFFIWVNEEDHMRIISMEEGGNIISIFKRWSKGIQTIKKLLEDQGSGYQFDDHFGYIHTCPSNLGTGLRASAMILLPLLSDALTPHQLEDFAKRFGVQARGGNGEHTPAGPGGKWDISNYQRIGFSEVELVQKMINGVEALIAVEQKLETGADIKSAMDKHADILDKVEPLGFPKWTTHKCLVRKVMDEPMYKKLSTLQTSKGFTLD